MIPPASLDSGGRDWTVVARSRQYERIDSYALALAAVGIKHEIDRRGDRWLLRVPAHQAGRARRHLVLYVRENHEWPPEKPPPPPLSPSPTVPLMGLLAVVYALSGPWRNDSPWFGLGAVARDAVFHDHEWWRLVTGLSLHADSVHLAGNLVIGGMLVHFLARSVGAGLGWSLAFIAGILGNLTNIWLQDATHLSVGFSTAVFGAVGALGGAIRGRGIRTGIFLPLGAAVGLLALLGTAGERTDLGAHLWGFAWGLVLGFLLVRPRMTRFCAGRLSSLVPWCWIGVFVVCWVLAWRLGTM